MNCHKCQGLVVLHNGEARCLNCGKYWFQPLATIELCSQGDGACTEPAGIDGLCQTHWQARLDKVNEGRRAGFRYKR